MSGHLPHQNGHHIARSDRDLAAQSADLLTALSLGDEKKIRGLIGQFIARSVDTRDAKYAAALADAVVAHSSGRQVLDATTPIDVKLSLEERVQAAIAAIRDGSLVVVMDGADRENEGDLIMAAEKATPEKIAFMVNETSGLICVSLEVSRCEELALPQMVKQNTESHGTAFTVSVDYKHGTTTGISAADRSATFRALADPKVTAADFARPGHVFPLRARAGGVLVRPGHTEASMDLARLAGLYPAGVLCEIVNRDGSMARLGRCQEFARQHNLPFITIADIIAYRQLLESNKATPAL